MTVSISITLDDRLGEDLDLAVGEGNRSALVAEAIREYLDRRAVAAAAAWHASLTGEDAAAFAEFNAAWEADRRRPEVTSSTTRSEADAFGCSSSARTPTAAHIR